LILSDLHNLANLLIVKLAAYNLLVNCNHIFTFRFYDKRDAEDALDAMDGRMLDGRELRVQMARYGRPTSPYRRRRRRYNILKIINKLFNFTA